MIPMIEFRCVYKLWDVCVEYMQVKKAMEKHTNYD